MGEEESRNGAVKHYDLDSLVSLQLGNDFFQLRNVRRPKDVQRRNVEGNSPVRIRMASQEYPDQWIGCVSGRPNYDLAKEGIANQSDEGIGDTLVSVDVTSLPAPRWRSFIAERREPFAS